MFAAFLNDFGSHSPTVDRTVRLDRAGLGHPDGDPNGRAETLNGVWGGGAARSDARPPAEHFAKAGDRAGMVEAGAYSDEISQGRDLDRARRVVGFPVAELSFAAKSATAQDQRLCDRG